MTHYETRPGDTPAIIAKEQLGDRDQWADVVVWNAQKCGFMGPHDWYRTGTILRLPEVEAMTAIDELQQARIERDRWKQLHDALARLVEVQARRMEFMQKIIDGEFPEGCTPADARVLREANHGLIAEIEQLRQERGDLRQRVAELVAAGTDCCDESTICREEWSRAIAGTSGIINSIRSESVIMAVDWLDKNYSHLSQPVCGLLAYYANQIEGGK